MSVSGALLTATLALYLLGTVLLGANLFLRVNRFRLGGRILTLSAVLIHGIAIGYRCYELHRAPFTTPAESLSLLAWVMPIIYLVTELRWRLSAVAPFALGLSFLLLLIGAGMGGSDIPASSHVPALLSQRAVSLHIAAIVAAIGAFALAFCCAALYLIEHYILKSKNGLLWMQRLPPLLSVENAAFTLVAGGFPLLTLGILSGLVRAWAGDLPTGWQTDPKALLAYAVWAVYGAYLLARLGARWSPVRTAYVLLVGAVLCVALFAVPSAVHRFG